MAEIVKTPTPSTMLSSKGELDPDEARLAEMGKASITVH